MRRVAALLLGIALALPAGASAQLTAERLIPAGSDTLLLPNVRMRDIGILPLPELGVYLAVSSAGRSVRAFTSRDLVHWSGPHTVFPEQWRNWRPRVYRGSQVLVSDSPLGPFTAFENRSTLPPDMMTLDATLWEEDGVPYIVYAHEWVQIKDGTIEIMQMTPDLSHAVGDPVTLIHAGDAPWAERQHPEGVYVTDAPWLYRTRTGKLLMIWSSFGAGGYMVGIAESTSGRLAGPWVHQPGALFPEGGGHPMLFRRFDGQLMMVLHQPNDGGRERAKLFEIEDTGESLRIQRPFPG